MLSVIVPACNEAACIDDCLASLLEQDIEARDVGGIEILVIANGCTDRTAEMAEAWKLPFNTRGWSFGVIERTEASKARALDQGDAAASGDLRAYIDADVVLSSALLRQVAAVLDTAAPRLASGTLSIAPTPSHATRFFAHFFIQLPFFRERPLCAGLYAVNASGRARWTGFSTVIADDTFVRAHFCTDERIEVSAPYLWPLAEGVGNLIRVRRRQEVGLRQLRRTHPHLSIGPIEPHDSTRIARVALRDPIGAFVYGLVTTIAKLTARQSDRHWPKGR